MQQQEDGAKKYEIEPQKVYARGDSAAKLFGWTFEEIGTMLVAVLGTLIFIGNTYVVISVGVLTYFYLKHLKDKLPERWFSSMVKHYLLRSNFLYRAGGRDTDWQPPIQPPDQDQKRKKRQKRHRR